MGAQARPSRTTVRGPRIVHGLLALRPPRIVYLPNQVTISEWTPWPLDPGTWNPAASSRMAAIMVLRPYLRVDSLAPGPWNLAPYQVFAHGCYHGAKTSLRVDSLAPGPWTLAPSQVSAHGSPSRVMEQPPGGLLKQTHYFPSRHH